MRQDRSLVVKHLVTSFGLPDTFKETAAQQETLALLANHLADLGATQAQAVAIAQAEANAIADEAEKAAAIENTCSS